MTSTEPIIDIAPTTEAFDRLAVTVTRLSQYIEEASAFSKSHGDSIELASYICGLADVAAILNGREPKYLDKIRELLE